MLWRIFVKDLESRIRIGIHDHEREAQRVLVNAEVEGVYSMSPLSIEDCFNYDHIYQLVVKEWPCRLQVQLLETLVAEALNYIFRSDARVCRATVRISKPDIFKEAAAVGVEASWVRSDYEKHLQ